MLVGQGLPLWATLVERIVGEIGGEFGGEASTITQPALPFYRIIIDISIIIYSL